MSHAVVCARALARLVLLVLSVLFGARPAGAQDSTTVTLMGEVRDFSTEQPIADIAVKLLELGLIDVTDRNGFFSFDSIPAGRWTFEASGLGYSTSVEASDIFPRALLLIRLEPAPIELEGLYVGVVQRLVQRRMAAPSRVYAWEKRELEEVIVPDVGSFVRTRGVARFVPCGGEWSDTDLPNCFIRKGLRVRLRVFIDDVELMPSEGTGRLWSYDPRELWSVEFLPGCRQLRVYTQWYMRMVEEGRTRLAHQLCAG